MLNHQGSPALSTARLLLRPYRSEDYRQVFDAWAGDENFTRYMAFPTHSTPDITKRLVDMWVEGYQSTTVYRWAIVYADAVIGDISVVRWNAEDEWCELGYCLGQKYWNMGLMTEALTRVLDYLFYTVGFFRVQLRHDACNPASGRVMQKCGLQPEGVLRGYKMRRDGSRADICLYAALREQWRAHS